MNIINEKFYSQIQNETERISPSSYNALMEICGAPDRKLIETLEPDSDQTLVSVVIPTHNRLDMLVRAIDSVLAQTHQRTEIIIIDDASSDDTPEIIPKRYQNEPRVCYLRNETSLGPGGARHRGYMNSHGDFLVYIDDDDYYIEPRFFEKALKKHAEYKSCALVAGNTVTYQRQKEACVFKPLNVTGLIAKEEYLMGFIKKYDKPSSSFPAMFRRSVLEKAGFDQMLMMNDASIYLRALCFGDAYILADIVGIYVLHSSNISSALPHKFLMENLEEKKHIYQLASSQYEQNVDQWYQNQIYSSVRYYFFGTKSTFEQKKEVLDWCKDNCGNVLPRLITAWIKRILYKINPVRHVKVAFWHLKKVIRDTLHGIGGKQGDKRP